MHKGRKEKASSSAAGDNAPIMWGETVQEARKFLKMLADNLESIYDRDLITFKRNFGEVLGLYWRYAMPPRGGPS